MTDGEVDRDRIARSVGRPPAAAAAPAIEAALDRGRVVTLVGECELDAPAGDRLPRGNRHALLKPDGVVVVHSRDGAAPDVVLSDDGGFDVTAFEGVLEIGATGDGDSRGEGSVRRLRFDRVDLLASAALARTDDATATEDRAADASDRHGALRERILADPDRVEPGFRPLSTERETSAGPVDLYGRDAEGRAVVVEIKAHRAGPAAVGQLDRYVAALRRDLHADAEVRGVLVAPSATDRTRHLLAERDFSFRALSPEP